MIHVAEHARELLEVNAYVVLATADADGTPWATPVWFAPDGLDRLYWASWPGSRHSQLVEHRPRIALSIFDSHAAPNDGAALYATAHARRCPQDQVEEALRVFNERATTQGVAPFALDRVTGEARLRLYVATYVDVWVLDRDATVDARARVPR